MPKKSTEVVASSIIWRLLERYGAQGVSFVVSIILARVLDPNVYGLVALVTVFTTILQVFVDGGLGNALIQKKNADDLDFSTVFYFNMILCALVYIALFLFAPAIAYFYNKPELVSITRIVGLTIIVSGLKNVQQAYVSRNMLFKKFFWATIPGTIIAAIIGIIMAYNGFGVWSLVSEYLLNLSIDTIILWITVKWRPKVMFSFTRLKTLFGFGWKLLVARLVETIYNESRSLIIGKKYSSSDLAFYNRGCQYPKIIVTNADYSISSVMFPVMSFAQDDKDACKSIVRKTIIMNTYIIAPMMMGLSVCAEPLIRLMLTDKWIFCIPYLRVFCFVYAFITFNTANMNAYRSLGRSDVYLRIEIIRKIVSIGILIASMWFGALGIAVGEAIATVISLFITASYNKKLLQYGPISQIKDTLPSLLITLLMGGLVFPISFINIPDYMILIIQICLGIVVYFGFSAIFKLYPLVLLMNLIRKKHL